MVAVAVIVKVGVCEGVGLIVGETDQVAVIVAVSEKVPLRVTVGLTEGVGVVVWVGL